MGYIITNEKCVGDTLCQKTFVSGFPYKSVINRGELDQYYIESTHPAIIDRETFDRAQQFYRQKISQRNPLPKSSMSLKIKCGVCGGILRRTKTRKHTVFWRCGTYLKEAAKCPICSIRDSEIQAAFVRMYNKLKLHKGTIPHPAAIQLDELTERVNRNNPAMLEVNKAIAQIAEQNYKISKLQADGLIDNDVCAAKIRSCTNSDMHNAKNMVY